MMSCFDSNFLFIDYYYVCFLINETYVGQQVLQELENEVAAYELQTGRRPQEESNKTETFSGYTIALVSAVSKLTKYLKEVKCNIDFTHFVCCKKIIFICLYAIKITTLYIIFSHLLNTESQNRLSSIL